MCVVCHESANIEKNSAVSEERHVLTAYVFFSGRTLGRYAYQELSEIPFPKYNSRLKLKIYINPSA